MTTSLPSANDSSAETSNAALARRLRVWPGIVLVLLSWVLNKGVALLPEAGFEAFMISMFGPLLCALGVLLWWALASRATGVERMVGLAGLIVAGFIANLVSHKSMQGFGSILYGVPWAVTVFVVAVTLLAKRAPAVRSGVALAVGCCALAIPALLRNDGVRGDMVVDLHWRWRPSAEDLYVKELRSGPKPASAAAGDWQPEPVVWPEFRGPDRDGKVPGVALATDWQSSPPRELWRSKIGPGWSSFCVVGNRLFTQEQRGDAEAVAAFDARTGSPIWSHEDQARFWEPIGGAGPRGTPTFAGGRLYTVGGMGTVNCLDPRDGKQIWTRDLRQDSGNDPPMWGFSSSPLVCHDLVYVHCGGPAPANAAGTAALPEARPGLSAKGLVAYDAMTGEIRWCVPSGDHTYSSPQLVEMGGKSVIVMLTNLGLTAHEPQTGAVVWDHAWTFDGYRVIQPLVIGGSSFLLGTTMGVGTRRIEVSAGAAGPVISELWTSKAIKPYFNDFVEHQGYLYGFDHDIFTCVDLANGKRMWKQGRYGGGQVVLLPDADQLLVISETGDLVLLAATPREHRELCRMKVFDNKTWNHPVLAGNRLYARNGHEMVAYDMPLRSAAAPERNSQGDEASRP